MNLLRIIALMSITRRVVKENHKTKVYSKVYSILDRVQKVQPNVLLGNIETNEWYNNKMLDPHSAYYQFNKKSKGHSIGSIQLVQLANATKI